MRKRNSGSHDISSIVGHYEECLNRFGDTPQGMDWPNSEELMRRFRVMSDIVQVPEAKNEILDLGCGSGLFLDYLKETERAPPWQYHGIDISQAMIEVAQAKHGANLFAQRDILQTPLEKESVDYVVMNGVLTEKRELSHAQMVAYAIDLIAAAYRIARIGIAFNIMSKNVDWERDDLFHWGMDELTEFLCEKISRHHVIRCDYGLYEYSVYVFREHAAQSEM